MERGGGRILDSPLSKIFHAYGIHPIGLNPTFDSGDGIRPTSLLSFVYHQVFRIVGLREFPKQKDRASAVVSGFRVHVRGGVKLKLDIFSAGEGGRIKLVRRWKFLISSRHRAVILNNPLAEGTMKLTVHGLCFRKPFTLASSFPLRDGRIKRIVIVDQRWATWTRVAYLHLFIFVFTVVANEKIERGREKR